MQEGDRGDLKIVRPNHCSSRLQLVAQSCIDRGGLVVERERTKWSERLNHSRQTAIPIAVLFGTM
jgi:hypothetical protein